MQTMTDTSPQGGYTGDRGRSFKQAAAILNLSVKTIQRRVAAGAIKAVSVSERRKIITDSEIARVLAGQAA